MLFSCLPEQHYLTELEGLGLVSYTPSREIQGKKICSYDDRYEAACKKIYFCGRTDINADVGVCRSALQSSHSEGMHQFV